MIDPRKLRATYLRVLGTQEAFDAWLVFFDRAVAAKSAIPDEVAWIEFKRRWVPRIDGGWERLEGVEQ